MRFRCFKILTPLIMLSACGPHHPPSELEKHQLFTTRHVFAPAGLAKVKDSSPAGSTSQCKQAAQPYLDQANAGLDGLNQSLAGAGASLNAATGGNAAAIAALMSAANSLVSGSAQPSAASAATVPPNPAGSEVAGQTTGETPEPTLPTQKPAIPELPGPNDGLAAGTNGVGSRPTAGALPSAPAAPGLTAGNGTSNPDGVVGSTGLPSGRLNPPPSDQIQPTLGANTAKPSGSTPPSATVTDVVIPSVQSHLSNALAATGNRPVFQKSNYAVASVPAAPLRSIASVAIRSSSLGISPQFGPSLFRVVSNGYATFELRNNRGYRVPAAR